MLMSVESPIRKKLFVSHKDESPRMFKSDFMDFFSRVPFYVPLIVYIPVIAYVTYRSFYNYNIPLLQFALLALGGIVFWSLTEYLLHRFVFHYHPTSELGKRLHFIAHGVHHDYPNDSLRLVMPPTLSIPIGIFFYFLFYLVLGEALCNPFFVGFNIGYLAYDELHYATHHATWKWGWFQRLKKHHMKHHYQNPDEGFGVSSPVWDHVFGSTFSEEK